MTAPKPPLPLRRMPRRALPVAGLLAAGAALSVVPAGAGDQRITGRLSQTFLSDTNTQLEAGGETSLGSITRLGLNYSNRTPSAQLSLGTGFNYSAFTGRNDDNISGLYPNLNGSYSVSRPTRRLGFTFSASIRPVDFFANTGLDLDIVDQDPFPEDEEPVEDPDDPGDDADPDADPDADGEFEPPDDDVVDLPDDTRAARETLRVNLSIGASYSRQLTQSASQSFGLRLARRDFLEDAGTLVPSTNLSANTGFNQQLTARSSWGVSAGSSLFIAEGGAERRTVSVNVSPSFRYNETPDIRYSFSLGPRLSVTQFERTTAAGREQVSEVSPGISGNAGLSYTDGPSTFGLSLTQGVVPDDQGFAVNRTGLSARYGRRVSATDRLGARVGVSYRTALSGDDSSGFNDTLSATTSANWSHRFNSRASGGLNANLRLLDDNAGQEATLGLGANLSYRLTRDVNASLGYNFRIQEDEGSGDFTSHRVSLTLSRPFTLLP